MLHTTPISSDKQSTANGLFRKYYYSIVIAFFFIGVSLKLLPHAFHGVGIVWELVGEIGTFTALIFSLHLFYELFVKTEDRRFIREEIQELLEASKKGLTNELAALKDSIDDSPKSLSKAGVEFVKSARIKRRVNGALSSTEFWYYFGATGRFVRAVVFPQLRNVATKKNETKEVKLLLIDPCNKDLISQYAAWRKNVPERQGEAVLNEESIVKHEIYATILSAYLCMFQQPLLKIKIAVRQYFSYHRLDITTNAVFITRDNADEDAMAFAKTSFLYSIYKEDFNAIFAGCKKLFKPGVRLSSENLSIPSVRSLFESLDICANVSDEEIDRIISLLRDSKDPYA